MGNALFIIWRESAEAMLVVGILYAWLRQRPDAATGMRFLWGGVAAGAGLALALALVMLGIASSLSGDALDYFQLAITLVAAALIVQMVFWMRRHGRTLKKDLESDMARQAGERALVGPAGRGRARRRPRERGDGRVPVRPRPARIGGGIDFPVVLGVGLPPRSRRSGCCSTAARCCRGGASSASARCCCCCSPARCWSAASRSSSRSACCRRSSIRCGTRRGCSTTRAASAASSRRSRAIARSRRSAAPRARRVLDRRALMLRRGHANPPARQPVAASSR